MSRRKADLIFLVTFILVLPCIGPTQVAGQCELKKIYASDGGFPANFGYHLRATDNLLVVADVFQNIYVFRRSFGTSMIEQQLPDPPTDHLSTSFDVYGERIVASVTGRVYVYEYDGANWTIVDQVTSADQFFMQNSFRPVPALYNDTLVLGAPYADDFCPSDPDCNSGAVYVFHWNGSSWTETQKLMASNAAPLRRFGYRLKIDQDRMLIGTPSGDAGIGSVYVFDWDGAQWTERAELSPSDGQLGWRFGTSFDLDGDRVVVGATQDFGCINGDDPCTPGAAYVYNWNGSTWSETQILTASDGVNADAFGEAVGIEANLITVGAYNSYSQPSQYTGAVYLFRNVAGNWQQKTRLTASDPILGSQFGENVSLFNGIAFVGSIYANGAQPSAGAVYMFGVDGDCDNNAQIDTCEILNDRSLDLNGNLQLDLCDHFIPTVSTWGVATMALVMLAAGSMIVRKRRVVA